MIKIANEIYGPTGQIISSQAGYGSAGASHKKRALKAFDAISGNSATDIDFHNSTLRQRSRVLYMASPLAASGILTNRTNIVGSGLKLNARINADILGFDRDTQSEEIEGIERHIEQEFKLWATDKKACDATGVNDFYSIQQLAMISWLLSGDSIVLKKYEDPTNIHPYGLRLHVIESDRISTPPRSQSNILAYNYALLDGKPLNFSLNITEGKSKNGNRIHDGVEVDKSGAIVAYYICSSVPHIGNIYNKPEWIRVPAYGEHTGLPLVYHIMDSERPEQYRGVPYLSKVIEPLLQLRRYTESELMAAVVQSFFTAFVKTEADPNQMPHNETIDDYDHKTSNPNDYEMGPGNINIMEPGESIEMADPKRPSSGFDSFVYVMANLVGAALEMPSDLLLKSFSKSYSASRAALLEAWKAFRMRREWLISDLCDPVYRSWFSEAVALGRIDAPGFFDDPIIRNAWTSATWVGPSQGQIDPLKEVQAETLAVDRGFSTHEISTTKINGGSWNKNMEDKKRENEKIKTVNQLLGGQNDNEKNK